MGEDLRRMLKVRRAKLRWSDGVLSTEVSFHSLLCRCSYIYKVVRITKANHLLLFRASYNVFHIPACPLARDDGLHPISVIQERSSSFPSDALSSTQRIARPPHRSLPRLAHLLRDLTPCNSFVPLRSLLVMRLVQPSCSSSLAPPFNA